MWSELVATPLFGITLTLAVYHPAGIGRSDKPPLLRLDSMDGSGSNFHRRAAKALQKILFRVFLLAFDI